MTNQLSRSLRELRRLQNLSFKLRSEIFIPTKSQPPSDSDHVLKSHKILSQGGYFHQVAAGIYTALPLGQILLSKIENILDTHLQESHLANKVTFPVLSPSEPWEKTKRWEAYGENIFTLHDRKKQKFLLCPTHEELFSLSVGSNGQLSHKSLPTAMYQITVKHRDEIRPRFGLLRAREFIMKDLYSAHLKVDEAQEYYEKVCEVYENILNSLKVEFVKVSADTGDMGGEFSHEFHILSDVGEDKLLVCSIGDFKANAESYPHVKAGPCMQEGCSCKGKGKIEFVKGIEIAHAYLLGTKYSEALKVEAVDESNEVVPVQMGCYGFGVSRLIPALLESKNINTKEDIIWPMKVRPFDNVVILVNEAGIENLKVGGCNLNGTVLIDDRAFVKLKRRILDAKLMGAESIYICGKGGLEKM
eukprot:snap_masked-scaffold_84-processed-gene-0.7-mRNA-1 protein AED:0.01 eAED:0.01 QI:51/1/1/1/0.5/0.33/3/706/416